MKQCKLLIVTGVSGAGKTVCMDFLEKNGYYCIDNLPIEVLVKTVLILKKETEYLEYAIAINSNTTSHSIEEALNQLKNIQDINTNILFLDVDNDVLIERFQFTRKKHPFTNKNESLVEAINEERLLLKHIRSYATINIDTSNYTVQQLITKLETKLAKKTSDNLSVNFISFGYKHGIPRDLDFALDTRFIKNPYYEADLRHLTGNNREVYEYVLKQPETQEFLKLLIPLLDFSIEQHRQSNRSYLVIGIGCTGGHHRSITLVNYLTDYYKKQYHVIKEHRDEFK